MKDKIELKEDEICERYKNENVGVESMSKEYHVGKKKIKDILLKNNIDIKKKGNQKSKKEIKVKDWKIEKYPKKDGEHYIAVDRNNGFTTKDYMNAAGVLTSHIKEVYSVEIPTLYDRREYYRETGNYWWEQWFDIKSVVNSETKKCPYCNWETVDIENKSGAFEIHLKKVHGIDKISYISNNKNEKVYFSSVSKQKNRQLETNKDNYVLCKVCGKKMARIDNNHLKTHGLTKIKYIEKFGSCEMVSKTYKSVLRKNVIENNKNMTFHKQSAQELEIKSFIEGLGFSVSCNRKILNGMEIDIFIPEKMIGFEYNGNFYHTEKYGKDKNYHLSKTVKCLENGVMLYHIFDDDFFLHKDVLFNKIKHVLGKSDGLKIRPNKCTIRVIEKNESDKFLKKYHIQGEVSSSLYIGAFYGDELVAVMCFLDEGNYKWVLTRFATNYNFIVPGIGGKLFSFFKKNYNFSEVKSFAERRLTPNIEKNFYTSIDFKLVEVGKPDYKYYNQNVDRYKRFHKFGFRKEKLHKKYDLPLTMTEKEMCDKLGFYRIWDCGLLKYVYTNPDYVPGNEEIE